MGADLYIKGYEKHYENCVGRFNEAADKRDRIIEEQGRDHPDVKAAQEEVSLAYDVMHSPEFYFRDSYNDSSVFHRLGLSWWNDLEQFMYKRPRGGVNVGPSGCKRLAALVESRELEFTPEDDEETVQYFVQKKAALIRFLHCCADAGGMDASV